MNKKKQSSNTSLASPLVEIAHELIKLMIDALKLTLKAIFTFIFKKFNNNSHEDVLITKKHVNSKRTSLVDSTIGHSASHKRDLFFDTDFNEGHATVLGSTGTGKTNLFYLIFDYAISKGNATMWFDPKTNIEAIQTFISINSYYNKETIIFSETEHANAKFNPLKNLNDSQILSLIINSFEWSDGEARYYKDRTIELIATDVLPFIRKEGKVVSLYSIYNAINDEFRCKEVSGFMSQLTILIKSPFGELFNDEDGSALTMLDIIDSKKSLYVGVSAQGYGAISRSIAKVLLSELQIRSHEIGHRYDPSSGDVMDVKYLCVDEAEALLYYEFINLLNKGRSSGFRIILATQTYSDFDTISKDFTRQIKTNCSNLFTFNLGNDKEGYEDISKTIGTLEDKKMTKATEDGEDSGRGSERDVNKFILHPQVAKMLPKGSCVFVRKFPSQIFALKVRDAKTLKSISKTSLKTNVTLNRRGENPRIKSEMKRAENIKRAIENSNEYNTSL